jgi:hypothetical protein
MRADEFKAEGWHSIDEHDIPPIDEMVEFARDERVYSSAPWFGRWRDFRPEFNVAGLWWRRP